MKIFITVLFSFILHFNLICQEPVNSSSQLKNATLNNFTTITDGNEKAPVLIGGISSLQSKIIYPKEAKAKNIEGKVFIKCKITTEGLVEEIKVVKGLGFGCDEEAIRVVKSSRWIPGKINNRPVEIDVTIPLIFKLENRSIIL
ncbi:Ferric siderophore transport system, periplasmic binding protein TonB [hydrothermal vent metagenome]|uniref:Ferric siderophore transport system, periplasmic binding protein TonB n=1 Tax=hydrothermal vent metagenome TaxID=652676 RepID=A0A3B1DHA6_9ZZZZ